jgi:aminopeptidase N
VSRLRATAALLLAALTALPAAAAPAMRLPRDLTPLAYQLELDPDPGAAGFSGRTRIAVAVNVADARVVLNALAMTIDAAWIEQGGQRIAAEPELDPEAETLTLALAAPLAVGEATIVVEYHAPYDPDLRGLYRGQGDGGPFVATQLEATDARRMFPGFDEPELKASFTLTTTVPAGMVALSNSPVAEETLAADGRRRVRFAPTPRIPTYLVALVIGELACLEDHAGRIALRVCAAPDRVALGRFALEATKRYLPWFEQRFGVPYPFAKLDQVALPEFAEAAMENAGLITYADQMLLLDPDRASTILKRWVASLVAHELAHHWFGNLVTMRWWDDLWLNEGFAEWAAGEALEALEPAWPNAAEQVRATGYAMQGDALESARAMHAPAETPVEITAAFDAVAYDKTAAVLRMLQRYAGAPAMRAGIAAHLQRFAWRDATGRDFAASLGGHVGPEALRVIESFAELPGVPLVIAGTRCDGGKLVVSLSQRRFLMDGASLPGAWSIPVCMRSASDERCTLLEAAAPGQLEFPDCGAPLAPNAAASGYFIAELDAAAHARLQEALYGVLDQAERLALLRDEWLLVGAGRRAIDAHLQLLARIDPLRERAVTEALVDQLSEIDRKLVEPKDRARFAALVRAQLAPAAAALGWQPAPGEDPERRLLRAIVFHALGTLADDRATQTKATALASAWLRDPATVDASLWSATLRIAAFAGDAGLQRRMSRALATSDDFEAQRRLRGALTAFRDPRALRASFDLALSPSLDASDGTDLLVGLAYNQYWAEGFWHELKARWPAVVERLPGSWRPSAPQFAAGLCRADAAEEIDRFFVALGPEFSGRPLGEAKGLVASCARLRAQQSAALQRYLRAAP